MKARLSRSILFILFSLKAVQSSMLFMVQGGSRFKVVQSGSKFKGGSRFKRCSKVVQGSSREIQGCNK